MPQPKHILVMRFSAMGDVAMTVPVIKELLEQNPDLHITYVSKPLFSAFFDHIPRLNFFGADIKKQYKGAGGLVKLYWDLKKLNFSGFADLHDSLRTRFIRNLFRLSGLRLSIIKKGRKDKKLLIRFPDKILKPLKHTTERYADVFRNLGLQITLSHQLKKTSLFTGQPVKIGIAPFAQHKGKIYPLNRMEEAIALLNHQHAEIYLFGGSPAEQETCEQWEQKYTNVQSTVNRMSLQQELQLITQLNVMVSMDSAGMHMASLVGTPVISVWGATHHYAGFLGYGQSEANIVADKINCRPCSIYGNKPCFRGDYACMYNLSPESIANKVKQFVLL